MRPEPRGRSRTDRNRTGKGEALDTQLEWNDTDGFVLNCQGTVDGVSLHLAGVAVPADGLLALANGVALYKLDLLFKAQASLGADLAQVVDGSVAHDGTALTLVCKVEDMETGDIRRVTHTADCPIDGGPPKEGGPVASEPDEGDLDMDDEFELPIPALPATGQTGSSAPSAKPPASSQDGIGRLLQALLQVEQGEDGPVEASPEPAGDVDAAVRFLQILVDNEGLEMEAGASLESIASGAATFLDGSGHPDKRAAALSEWLLEQEGVEDLYISDEDLGHLISQW